MLRKKIKANIIIYAESSFQKIVNSPIWVLELMHKIHRLLSKLIKIYLLLNQLMYLGKKIKANVSSILSRLSKNNEFSDLDVGIHT